MPFVMLKKQWPGTFRRTIKQKVRGKEVSKSIRFTPGVPVELTADEVELLRGDIGHALQPIEFDEKARPRIITDEVEPEQSEAVTSAPKSTD